jgi:anaerobic magnesium-protoporphyrin IX monomethyl ester cyclase
MKVLFINPRSKIMGINVGLGYLISTLKQQGHEATGLDLNNYRHEAEEELVGRFIERINPNLIGFSVISLNYKLTKDLIRKVKQRADVPVIIGGAHTMVENREILDDMPEVDYLVCGEGEETLVELLEAVENKRALAEVAGIVYREKDELKLNPPRPFMKELDRLPFPDYRAMGIRRIAAYPLLTSRGCPYRCIFCMAGVVAGRRWRARKVETLIAELHHARKTYACESFNIVDDCFTFDMNRAKRFCEALIRGKIDLPWSCTNGIRADKVDDELAYLMSRSGCREVSLGVESLVPEVFMNINKGERLESIVEAVRIFKKNAIRVNSFHVIGLPGDTYQRTLKSYRLSKQYKFNRSIWQLLVPFPQTKLEDWVKQNAKPLASYHDVSSSERVCFETLDYPAKKRWRAFVKLSFRNGDFSTDSRESYLKKGMRLLYLMMRYDFFYSPVHIIRLTKKALQVISTKGERSRRVGIVFGKEFFKCAGLLD